MSKKKKRIVVVVAVALALFGAIWFAVSKLDPDPVPMPTEYYETSVPTQVPQETEPPFGPIQTIVPSPFETIVIDGEEYSCWIIESGFECSQVSDPDAGGGKLDIGE